jgi:hypothetical protein
VNVSCFFDVENAAAGQSYQLLDLSPKFAVGVDPLVKRASVDTLTNGNDPYLC